MWQAVDPVLKLVPWEKKEWLPGMDSNHE